MTDPSQYFRGRTVQEQMNEVIGYVDVRSAEVATDAIAADVAQVHSDAADAHSDALAAAASAAAAVGTLANAVKKTGEASQSIAGDIAVAGDLTGGTVTVPAPVNNTDAANKKYVDDADALKADKTYVDTQDALKINITSINSYAVGLTGNQTYAGIKTMTEFARKQFNIDITEAHGDVSDNIIQIFDNNSHLLGYLYMSIAADNHTSIRIGVRNSDGTLKESTLLSGDHP